MMTKRLQKSIYSILVLASVSFSACKISYSFTGADIPVEAKTFSVEYFQNDAPLADPDYPLQITEALKDLMLNQSGLNLVRTDGDLQFSGVVSNYIIQPTAVSGNDAANLNRLSISISVNYINRFEEEKNFEKSFSRFADFDANQDLNAVKDGLIEDINEQLVQDIFNASIGNW